MTEYMHLGTFFVILFGVVVLPGLDMAYVLGGSLTGGRGHGLVAVAGLVTGGVVHVTVGSPGVATFINYVPGLFNLILLAGVIYIAWLGCRQLRSSSVFEANDAVPARSPGSTLRQALTNLLNPKPYLLMLAIFPQFLRPEYGELSIQAVVLGGMIAASQVTVYGSVAFAASGLRLWIHSNRFAGTVLNRIADSLLLVAAVVATSDGWRGP